ncbi:MAG: hypothetical protein NZ934_00415 [Hadesarchaea archaeon]|nr:hypothetical protein [Hadesarchaea archaeon]
MKAEEKLRLNNRLTYLATIVLTAYFFLVFFLLILPKLPQTPSELGEWRVAISSWNLGGSTMFTLVFRIQLLRGALDRLGNRRERMKVTPWVWFWFVGLTVVGLLSLITVVYSYLSPGIFASQKVTFLQDFLTLLSLALWVTLLILSISLLRECRKCSSGIEEIRMALKIHRFLLGPSTLAFFLFSVVVAPTSFFFV